MIWKFVKILVTDNSSFTRGDSFLYDARLHSVNEKVLSQNPSKVLTLPVKRGVDISTTYLDRAYCTSGLY